MKLLHSAPAWIAAVLLFAIAALLIAFGWLFSIDHSVGDRVAAAGAILGGLIGAGGAALAVYLTLSAQRADEAEKVEASLRAEVSEFARLAIGQLDMLTRRVLPGEQPLFIQDLPELVGLPEPVVFKATADRISRLPYGPLLVMLHVRTAEVKQMARIYILSGSRSVGSLMAHLPIGMEEARTLATAWYDICMIAHAILKAAPSASQLVEAALHQTLGDLDASLAHADRVLGTNPRPKGE